MARDDRKPGSRMGSSMKDRVKVRAQERKTGGGGTKFQNIPLGTSFFQAKKGAVNIDVIPYVISVDNHPSGLEKGELQKRVDAVKQLIQEYRDHPTEDKTFCHALSIVAYELEQALKGGEA
jgi:acyl-[acyl carrier protein]--UDP-N-acetylglucosamine O-acyltransferase